MFAWQTSTTASDNAIMMPMTWIVLSLFSALLYASVTHLDKYLLSKFFRGRTVGALVLFSSFVSLPILPIFHFWVDGIYAVTLTHAVLLSLNGAIYMASLLPYFFALDRDETSIVAPLFLMVSVFSTIMGYLFLNETILTIQLVGCLLIISGALVLSIDTQSIGKIRIKKDVFLLMMASSFLMALNGVLFKFVAVRETFTTSLFWEYIGYAVFAFFVFFLVPAFRAEFVRVFTRNRLPIIGANLLNEVLSLIAKFLLNFATLLTSLAFAVIVHEGAQPLFVIVLGIMLTKFFPAIARENISAKTLVRKTLAIGAMVLGTIFLR